MPAMEHWKKDAVRKNRGKLLDLLREHDRLCSKDLEEKLDISAPTLSTYLKTLTKEGMIEKTDEGTRTYWRIKPESKKRVEALLSRNEVIKFIESIDDPVYTYRELPNKKGAMAFFASLSKSTRKDVEVVLPAILEGMEEIIQNFVQNFSKEDKLAFIITAGDIEKEGGKS